MSEIPTASGDDAVNEDDTAARTPSVEKTGDRSGFVAVDQRTTPDGGSYWLPLGPTRSTIDGARFDGTSLGVDLSESLPFVVAEFRSGEIARVLDVDGDPVDGWDAEALADLRAGIYDVWGIEEETP